MRLPLRCAMSGLLILCAVAIPWVHATQSVPTRVPGDSVYQLNAALVDQDGHTLNFSEGRGKPRIVSMLYSACPYMCPLIIETLKKTEHALPEADRKQLQVLFVSFDAERDTPAALRAMADKRNIDTPRWTLAHASAPDVRRIAAVLGIQYRQLQNREFSHSSVLVLLDAQGRIVARTETMGDVDAEFVAAVTRVLGAR